MSIYESIDVEGLTSFFNNKTGYIKRINDELNTFCPFCESDKFHNYKKHGHLYINLNTLQTNCFKCEEAKGVVFKVIKKLGGDCSDFVSGFSFDEIRKSRNDKMTNSVEKYSYSMSGQEEDRFKDKKDYIERRTNSSIVFSKLNNVVFSIKDFIRENNISLNMSQNMIDYIEKNYVGFLGTRGTILVFRNIRTSGDRYINIKLKSNVYFKDFYGVQVRQVHDNTNTIVLCEGVFDLLTSIKNDKFNDVVKNTILWAACLNKSFRNSVISVLDYCKISKANFIFLSDSDVSERDYYWVFEKPYIGNVDIYWNRHHKDFGELPIDPIKVKIKIGDTRYGRNTSHSTNNERFYKNETERRIH